MIIISLFLFSSGFLAPKVSAANINDIKLLDDCPTCHISIANCKVGHVLQKNCVRCVCEKDRVYHCDKLSAKCDYGLKNEVIRKPTKATCNPGVAYIINSTNCICNQLGQWPHEKCENLFKFLHQTEKLKKKCEPDTYIIRDCNVCKCNLAGEIDETHCTKNNCSDEPNTRRRIDSVLGSCEAGNWYSLAPCQFCYCVNTNKLICSTGNTKTKQSLEVGSYHLTTCGKELIKDVIELVPEAQKSLRQDRIHIGLPSPTVRILETTSRTTKVRHQKTTVTTPSIPFEEMYPMQLSSSSTTPSPLLVPTAKSEDNEETTEQEMTGTALSLPFEGAEESDANDANDDDSDKSKEADNTAGPEKLQQDAVVQDPQQSVMYVDNIQSQQAFGTMGKISTALPIQMSSIKPSDVSVSPDRDVLKIHLPSMIDKLLKMVLRKSNVRIENTACKPGDTVVEKCKNCFCLANGKMLCTHKKC